MKKVAILLELPEDVENKVDLMNKWEVDSKTSNIHYSKDTGVIQIKAEGYYVFYLQMMPAKPVALHQFILNKNGKVLEDVTWSCPKNNNPCAGAINRVIYLQKEDVLTITTTFYVNAKWKKDGTVLYLYM